MVARILQFKVIPGKFEDAIATMNEQIVPKLADVDDMTHCIITHNPDSDECVTTAIYRDQASAEAAQVATQQIWAAMGPFLAGPPTLQVKNVLLAHNN